LKLRTAVLPALAAVALLAPATAPAATLTVDKPCYGPGEQVRFTGAGFTPSGQVALSVSGQQLGIGTADPAGGFGVGIGAPTIDGKQRTDVFIATDQTNLALTATVPVLLTSLNVNVTPRNGNPGRTKKIVARGFTSGATLYAHVRRNGAKRNIRIGRLKGACKGLTARRKLFSTDAKSGVYKVQFDTKRKYSAKTVPQVAFRVTVFRTARPASASASSGERWVQIR